MWIDKILFVIPNGWIVSYFFIPLRQVVEPGILLVDEIRRLQRRCRIVRRLDGQCSRGKLFGGVFHAHGEEDTAFARILRRVMQRIRHQTALPTGLYLHLLQGDTLGKGEALQQVHFLIDL